MLALISSTVFPASGDAYGGQRSVFAHEARLEQTIATVRSLEAIGLGEVVIADNSGRNWRPELAARLKPAKVLVFEHPQFRNRGLAETLLLLTAVEHLPAETPILKISGRYMLSRVPELETGRALLVKFRDHGRSVSTLCYVARNRDVLREYLTGVLSELFRNASRIAGPRSLARILRAALWPALDSYPYHDPTISIEMAGARAIRRHGWPVQSVSALGVRGQLGLTGEPIEE